ncbi:MAG: hypothetical protein Q9161_003159 [Pseudevernia consocians]
MGTNVVAFSFRQAVLAVTLSSSFVGILALPAFPLSLNVSPVQVNTSSLLVPPNPRPPQEPTCPSNEEWGPTLGHPSYDDCDYVLSNLYPKDPLTKPVTRNFYSALSDVSHTISNFRLPYEESYSKHFSRRTSNVLLATDFNSIPYDQATWNDLRGATRTILRTCIRGKEMGGLLPKNGNHGNIEIVVYGKDSIFAKNQILKNSQDPLARSIAAQELLELMNVVLVPLPQQTALEMGTVAKGVANASTASGLATTETYVETS